MGRIMVFEIPKRGYLFRVSHPEDLGGSEQEARDMAACDEMIGEEIPPPEKGYLKLEFKNGIKMKLKPE